MSLKAKCKILYPTYPSPDYAKSKVRYSYDRVKTGTIGVLETVTEEAEVSLIEENGKRGYEFEASFLTRMSHLKDTPITALPYPPWSREGLVLELLFTEGKGNIAYDTSGNENHGTVYGAVWKEEPLGGSLYFDGVDDYVEVADSPSLRWGYNPFTIEFLVKLPQKDQHQGILRRETLTQGYLNIFFHYSLRAFGVETRSSDTNELFSALSASVEWDKWNHAVLVREDPYWTWYTNGGNPRKSEDTRSGRECNYSSLILAPLRTTRMLGYFAFVRIYNRTLSESEIKSHYNWLVSQGVFG